ncbi:MAG TPA: lactonase family protein [Bryobacteraceae bacterium]|nr:lactonase family protein [Bryobacteraceae bacterium]
MKQIACVSACAALLALAASPLAAAAKGEFLVYVGTYTSKGSQGIYGWRLDAGSGKLTPLGLAAETVNPSFLAVHPNRKFVYAVSEISGSGGQKGGAVSAFAIDRRTGKLSFLNRVSSRGNGPCYVAVDKSGKVVLVANYGSGSVAALPVKEDGSLAEASGAMQHAGSSVNPQRQKGPHAHSINVSPDNRYALAADLGLDQVLVYRLNAAAGSLEPNDPPFAKTQPGAGPRHLAFHPGGKYVYVINEMGSSLSAFAWEAGRGALKPIETVSTLPKGFQGENYCAEVQVHPNGRFVYGSNRGHDSIAVFALDRDKGTLTPVEHVSTQGKFPRNFGIDPTGSWLFAANQNSGNITVFRIDPKSGRLTPAGQNLDVSMPVCVRFVALD